MISISNSGAKTAHPLARFVTVEAIALLLNLKPHKIYRIDCWRYEAYVKSIDALLPKTINLATNP